MRKIAGWFVAFWFGLRFVLSRLKIGKRPNLDHYLTACTEVVDTFTGLYEDMRIRGGEKIPLDGPLMIAANHFKLDDPCVIAHALHRATERKRKPRFMMRHDFFTSWIFRTYLFNAVEFFKCVGAYPVDRDNVTLRQMKPFLEVLERDECFVIFPGRTRSQSGLLIEYRGNFTEPGGLSFFVRQAQRRRPEARVAVLPVARSFNPATGMSTVVFGEPLYLANEAGKEAARRLDYRLVEAIGGLFEVSVTHIVATVLAFRAMSGREDGPTANELVDIVDAAREASVHPYAEANYRGKSTAETVEDSLRYFARHGMIRRDGEGIRLHIEAIRHEPGLDSSYRDVNPVKFLCNQIVHLGPLLAFIERLALEEGAVRAAK